MNKKRNQGAGIDYIGAILEISNIVIDKVLLISLKTRNTWRINTLMTF